MRKRILLAVATVLCLGATAAFAGSAPATGVNGSMHDIGSQTGKGYRADDFGRVCIYCHTPHNAVQANALDPAPLWNRAETSAVLTPYVWSAPGNIAAGLGSDPLIGPSRLCLSCHDGATAADSHGPTMGTAQGGSGSQVIATASGRAWTDLTGTHPIGFSYPDAFTARTVTELVNPATGVFVGTVGTDTTVANRVASGFLPVASGKKISDTLYNGGLLTCASCHDVHNTNNAKNPTVNNGATPPNYFVWAPENASALCLSCHVK
jgi:cytochrome c553